MSLSTPVAFIIFNRPDLTKKVFERIAQAKPEKLLVVADGPRFPEEEERCTKAREAIKIINWDCEVLTNYSDTNLGCKRRVSSGLDWVFSEVEEAIILEDDCLPTLSFFYFCEELLNYYRHDERIMMISGDNFQNGQSRTSHSYYFSKYSHIWGWASWRRAWQHYDVEMKTWPEYSDLDLICSVCENIYEQKYWIDIFDRVYNSSIDTWDYQWLYTCWSQSGLSILPNQNLVSNIGFGSGGTHTTSDSSWANLHTFDVWNLSHPSFVTRNVEADTYTFDHHYGGESMKRGQSLVSKARHYLSNFKDGTRNLFKGSVHA